VVRLVDVELSAAGAVPPAAIVFLRLACFLFRAIPYRGCTAFLTWELETFD
jgi:hypothetical protein